MENKEISIGTLYDMNKSIMTTLRPLDNQEIEATVQELADYISENEDVNYWMLLNRERGDYTVFKNLHNPSSAEHIANEVILCLTERGVLMDVEKQSNGCYECWIKRSGVSYMYPFFPYDAAVIEC